VIVPEIAEPFMDALVVGDEKAGCRRDEGDRQEIAAFDVRRVAPDLSGVPQEIPGQAPEGVPLAGGRAGRRLISRRARDGEREQSRRFGPGRPGRPGAGPEPGGEDGQQQEGRDVIPGDLHILPAGGRGGFVKVAIFPSARHCDSNLSRNPPACEIGAPAGEPLCPSSRCDNIKNSTSGREQSKRTVFPERKGPHPLTIDPQM
jgi:hypothetical protein